MFYSNNDEPMILEKKGSQKQTNQQILEKPTKKITKKVDEEKSGNVKTRSAEKQKLIDDKIKFFLEDGIKDIKYTETKEKNNQQKVASVDENNKKIQKEKEERERLQKQQMIDQAIQFFLEDGIKDIKQPPKKIIEETKQLKEEKPKEEIKQPIEESISFDNKSIEFLSNKLTEEYKNNADPLRIKLISDVLFNRINLLTMHEQILLMKSALNKFSSTSSTYKTIRDTVLLNLMDKFVEKKYRQSLTLTPQSIETSHLGDIQKFVSMLTSDQVKALKKINNNYIPPVPSNSPEYYHFKEATKGIQATIDHSIDARGPGNNIYEDLQNNMSKGSFSKQYEKLQRQNNPIDVYKVHNPEQVKIAQELAEEIKEKTGAQYQIVLSSDLIMDSHQEDKNTEHSNDMYDAHVMEKNYTGNNSR